MSIFDGPDLGLMVNRDGILWADAPLPRRWHRCKVWTAPGPNAWKDRILQGFDGRCACGAIKWEGHWMRKNERRHS